MKAKTTYILIADGARARILSNRGPGSGLSPVLNHDFAASRAPSRDYGTDKPGRTHRSGVGNSRHAMEPSVDWHVIEKQRFARTIARILDKAAERKEFDRLVLVAPPATLGDLRSSLGKRAEGLVSREMGKDLTHLTLPELTRHLEDVILL